VIIVPDRLKRRDNELKSTLLQNSLKQNRKMLTETYFMSDECRIVTREHGRMFLTVGLLVLSIVSSAQDSRTFNPFNRIRHSSLPANARSCQECHAAPVIGGSSRLTVTRVGDTKNGRYIPAENGGILHTIDAKPTEVKANIHGLRVSLNLLGDGYVEAISARELELNAQQQALKTDGMIHGEVVRVSPVESRDSDRIVGRFGWKAQHATILDAAADALRNELGIPNRIFPTGSEEDRQVNPAGRENAGFVEDELNGMVEFIQNTEPIAPDPDRTKTKWARAGSQIFDRIGCSLCHVRTLRTAPTGTKMSGSGVVVTDRLGNKEIHPFSDYLLHDVGTGDGIVQNIRPEDYDGSTANKFRTAPLWGVRFRSWLMHDGRSITYHQAIMRHGGEASEVVQNYVKLTPIEKEQLRLFLDSL